MGRGRIECRQKVEERLGQLSARGLAAGGKRRGTPVGIGKLHEREIEKPLAGIIQDINGKPPRYPVAAEKTFPHEFDGETQLAQPGGAIGPSAARGRQRLQMRLISKSRKLEIGLRLEVSPRDAA